MNNVKCIAFEDVPIGAEFWWGGYTIARCNWGRKRSSRTAEYRICFRGKPSNHTDWGYWRARESVYVICN